MSCLLRSLLFLFLVSSFLNTSASLTQPDLCNPDQRDALLEFKAEFFIMDYSDTSSNQKTESWMNKSDCCSWGGIKCDAKSGKVIGLDLSDSYLYGRLESNSSLFRLRHLSSLDLSYNNFSGKIPFSLGNLSRLSSLDLSVNNFIGEIPSSIGSLKQLTVFNVRDNKLSGNLPSSLLSLIQLRSIDIDTNQFTGILPPNISQLSKLESFYAFDNFFTGAIPSSLFKIPSLTVISLYDNQLSDLAGMENISILSNLQYLHIGDNNYRFSSLDFNLFSPFKQLVGLSLSNTPLSTTNITSDFLLHVRELNLLGCNIAEFPEFVRYQRNLSNLNLSNNKIKGQVPNWLWSLPELNDVDLSNNSLSGFKGSLEASPKSHIYSLDLSSNSLQGPIFIPPVECIYGNDH